MILRRESKIWKLSDSEDDLHGEKDESKQSGKKGAGSYRFLSERVRTKPDHYKVICISMYNKDLARLDKMVDHLKERGLTKANRSALIRCALEQVDLNLNLILRGI